MVQLGQQAVKGKINLEALIKIENPIDSLFFYFIFCSKKFQTGSSGVDAVTSIFSLETG